MWSTGADDIVMEKYLQPYIILFLALHYSALSSHFLKLCSSCTPHSTCDIAAPLHCTPSHHRHHRRVTLSLQVELVGVLARGCCSDCPEPHSVSTAVCKAEMDFKFLSWSVQAQPPSLIRAKPGYAYRLWYKWNPLLSSYSSSKLVAGMWVFPLSPTVVLKSRNQGC